MAPSSAAHALLEVTEAATLAPVQRVLTFLVKVRGLVGLG